MALPANFYNPTNVYSFEENDYKYINGYRREPVRPIRTEFKFNEARDHWGLKFGSLMHLESESDINVLLMLVYNTLDNAEENFHVNQWVRIIAHKIDSVDYGGDNVRILSINPRKQKSLWLHTVRSPDESLYSRSWEFNASPIHVVSASTYKQFEGRRLPFPIVRQYLRFGRGVHPNRILQDLTQDEIVKCMGDRIPRSGKKMRDFVTRVCQKVDEILLSKQGYPLYPCNDD